MLQILLILGLWGKGDHQWHAASSITSGVALLTDVCLITGKHRYSRELSVTLSQQCFRSTVIA
jgi:hypothetical protein